VQSATVSGGSAQAVRALDEPSWAGPNCWQATPKRRGNAISQQVCAVSYPWTILARAEGAERVGRPPPRRDIQLARLPVLLSEPGGLRAPIRGTSEPALQLMEWFIPTLIQPNQQRRKRWQARLSERSGAPGRRATPCLLWVTAHRPPGSRCCRRVAAGSVTGRPSAPGSAFRSTQRRSPGAS
jgi:hypothetical protein